MVTLTVGALLSHDADGANHAALASPKPQAEGWQRGAAIGKAGTGTVFHDGFETATPAAPLQGQIALENRSFDSPEAFGSQIESLASSLNPRAPRFLHSDTSTLARVSPDPVQYLNRVEFAAMNHSGAGTVQAPLTPVDLSLADPSASTSGCEAADFNGFPSGHIALIQRSTCSLYGVARNAEAAGAVGAIIFNQGTSGRTGFYVDSLADADNSYEGELPVAATTFTLGQSWSQNPGATFRLRIDAGQQSNAWELKPVLRPDAAANTFWIRNSATGKLLRPGALTFLNGSGVHRLEEAQLAADDPRGWWLISDAGGVAVEPGAARIRNVDNAEYLTAIPSSIEFNAAAIAVADLFLETSVCPNNPSCSQWRVDQRFVRPVSGATHLRSALGDSYLHVVGSSPKVDRVKPAWPSAEWILEPVPNTPYRRLLNVSSGDYLHVQNGSLEAGEVEADWQSAMWTLEAATEIAETTTADSNTPVALDSPMTGISGYLRLRNRLSGELLVTRNGDALTDASADDKLEALWVRDDGNVTIADANLRDLINSVLNQVPDSPIGASEAAGIHVLDGGAAGIASLNGLDALFNLRSLVLSDNTFTDTSPLSALTQLTYLDLSRGQFTSIVGLINNEGLDEDDRVLMLQSKLGQLPKSDGDVLYTRRAIVLPGPGLTTLHYRNNGQVVDATFGALSMVSPLVANNGANWDIEYDPVSARYLIRNASRRISNASYLGWNEQDNRLELTGRQSAGNAEWIFEEIQNGIFRIRNHRLNGTSDLRYLQICNGQLEINNDTPSCVVGDWLVDGTLLQAAQDRALASFYDPRFAAPDGGFTRIQHTKTREFLNLDGGGLAIGQVDAGSLRAQWKLLPVAFDTTYYFAIQNRELSSTFLYRDSSGATPVLRAGPPPGSPPGPVPGNSSWALDPANAAFLFRFDGTEAVSIEPLLARSSHLRANSSTLSFIEGLGSDTFWRLDGGIKVPAPSQSNSFLELRLLPAPGYVTRYEISWIEYSGPGGQAVRIKRTGAGVYTLPANARDIKAKAFCVGCGITSDTVIFDKTFDLPPNKCWQTAGNFVSPFGQTCTPSVGELATFANNAANQATCEIQQLIGFVPTVLEAAGVEDISKDLLAGRFNRAKRQIFNFGNMKLQGPDFSRCEFYQSMSFGAGARAGALTFDGAGEIGVAWGLGLNANGATTYTSASKPQDSLGGGQDGFDGRLLSAEATMALGLWRDKPEDRHGKSIGLSLTANREVEVVLKRAKKESKKIGLSVSAGLTMWFACSSGSGDPVFTSADCELRNDARYLGLTFDFSAGKELAIPLPTIPNGIGLTFTETCVPANFVEAASECSN